MASNRRLAHAVLGASVLAAIGVAPVASGTDDAQLRADLQRVAQRRVYFGHQSVGSNLLDGVRELASRSGVEVRIVEVRAPGGVPVATFGHGLVASNGKPFVKLESFREAFESGAAAGAELALLKFCYVDFDATTDVQALFAAYQATIRELKARHPGTTFVHATAPLVAVPGGVKESLRRYLGREQRQLAGNAQREAYNALVRQAYAGREPLFDLARVESTRPDGAAEDEEWQGRRVPAMVAAYTSDGGHLNAEGRLRAARELVAVLAGAPAPPAGGARR